MQVPCSSCWAERRHPRALRGLPGWAAATGTVTGIAVVRALFDERAEATMLCRLFLGHSEQGSAPFSAPCSPR